MQRSLCSSLFDLCERQRNTVLTFAHRTCKVTVPLGRSCAECTYAAHAFGRMQHMKCATCVIRNNDDAEALHRIHSSRTRSAGSKPNEVCRGPSQPQQMAVITHRALPRAGCKSGRARKRENPRRRRQGGDAAEHQRQTPGRALRCTVHAKPWKHVAQRPASEESIRRTDASAQAREWAT